MTNKYFFLLSRARCSTHDAIALLIRNVSINTLNSNRLIRNTRSESIAKKKEVELIARLFSLYFRASIIVKWNAVVVFPVSVCIYESLIIKQSTCRRSIDNLGVRKKPMLSGISRTVLFTRL